MTKPIVSVIVAVYNVGQYLEECIKSLVIQTEDNIEIILVNDGSTDDSAEICNCYAAKDSRIRVIHQTNAGVSAARNAGIEAACADWIAFVDGDDFLDKRFVERMYSEVQDNIDIICCAYSVFRDGNFVNQYFFPDEFVCCRIEEKKCLYYQLMNSHYGQSKPYGATGIGVPWAKLYRVDLIRNIKFNINLPRMQDNVFNMEVFYHARGIKYIKENLYVYRINHISKLWGVSYSPEIRAEVIRSRDSFFKVDPIFLSDDFMKHRIEEKVACLTSSCMNIVMTSQGYRDASQKFRKLVNIQEYENVLNGSYKSDIPRRRMIVNTLSHKRFRLLYFGVGYYWRTRKFLYEVKNKGQT